jgi:chorismate--pyruvate lyase
MNTHKNTNKTRSIAAVQWQPAERLGQLAVDAHLRPWLIGKGLLTERLRAACGGRFALHVAHTWAGDLNAAQRTALRVADNAGLFRAVEMFCGDQVWVFGETVIPDSTLSAHPWLAELGDSALGETLSGLSGVERGAYEYAWLPASDEVTARALSGAQIKPAGLWARRSRIALRSAPMLVHELFLPALGSL